MKRSLLSVLFGLVLLTGCARHYVITLSNGMRVTTVGKPRREGGSYVFKDATGRQESVSVGRVKDIAPASMAEPENDKFNPKPLQ